MRKNSLGSHNNARAATLQGTTKRSPLCLSAYSCSQLHDQFDMLILLSSPPFVPGCNVVFIPWSRIPQPPRKRLLLPAPHARVALHPSGGVGRESRPREGKGDADDGRRRRDQSITNFVDRLIRPREKLRQFPIQLHPTPRHEHDVMRQRHFG